MGNHFFAGLFDAATTAVIAPEKFLLCLGVSLAMGWVLMKMMMWRARSSASFAVTLATIPAAVCVVIMLVNGNVGTGVAVAGAFSLVRFRSAAGSGREICAIFIAMTVGLIAGMGYLAYAGLFGVTMGLTLMGYTALGGKPYSRQRRLYITIPESLDYAGVFDPVLKRYTRQYDLRQVKTTNLGSLFKLTYDITLAADANEKALLDELRCHNGNLELSLSYQDDETEGL